MENVGRCPKCKKFLIAENAETHECKNAFRTVKEIPVLFYFETKDANTIIARAWNGILYRLVKTLNPSDGSYRPNPSDEDLTEPSKATMASSDIHSKAC